MRFQVICGHDSHYVVKCPTNVLGGDLRKNWSGSSICILTATAEQKQILLDAHGGAAVRCVVWIDRNTLVSGGADKLRIWEHGETGQ